VAAALCAAGRASADERHAAPPAITVEVLSGSPVEGTRLVSLDAQAIEVETAQGRKKVALDDVVEIGTATPPDAQRASTPTEVAVDLWSGESVRGEYRGGDGDTLAVESPLLGALRIPVESVAGVRFLLRLSQAAEPPDLRSRKESDVVHLAGGDQFNATLETFGTASVRFVGQRKEPIEVPLERLTAIRLLDESAAAQRPARALSAALRDGSRVVGGEPRLAESKLRMRSPSGFDVECALADVIAVQVVSPAFAWLSDVEPSATEVKPFWEPVAGDPAVLFAPRRDQSFSGRPLRCGGRVWLDGLGVFSGTSMTWKLDGAWREFRTAAGIDDGAGRLGGVVFRVLVDGKEAWNSGFVRAAGSSGRGREGPVRCPPVSLEGAKTLTLQVLAGDDEDPWPVQDEADWLGALVVRAGKAQAPK